MCCRRTGVMRSAGPKRHESTQGRHNPIKHKRKPPKGMYLDQNDLMAMVTGLPGQSEAILRALDGEVVTLKRQVSSLLLQPLPGSNGIYSLLDSHRNRNGIFFMSVNQMGSPVLCMKAAVHCRSCRLPESFLAARVSTAQN